MKKKAIVALALCLVLAALSGCGCKHEWKEATCTEPSTCAKCGETKGEPLGHDAVWEVKSSDFVAAKRTMVFKCQDCGEELETKEETLTTFVEDGKFIFGAQDYIARLQKLWDDEHAGSLDLTFKYGITSKGKMDFDIYNRNDVWLGWGIFYDKDGNSIEPSSDAPICAISVFAGPVDNIETQTLLFLFKQLCGPCASAADPSLENGAYTDAIVNNTYNRLDDGKTLNGVNYSCGLNKDNGEYFILEIAIPQE